MLKWLMDRAITPHVPVWDKSARADGKFSRADFVFDRERNVYVCPAGKLLTHDGAIDQGRYTKPAATREALLPHPNSNADRFPSLARRGVELGAHGQTLIMENAAKWWATSAPSPEKMHEFCNTFRGEAAVNVATR
jgi:hypothetical protein